MLLFFAAMIWLDQKEYFGGFGNLKKLQKLNNNLRAINK